GSRGGGSRGGGSEGGGRRTGISTRGGGGGSGAGRRLGPLCVTAKISRTKTTPPTPAQIISGFAGFGAAGRRGAGTIGMWPVEVFRCGGGAGILPDDTRRGAVSSSPSLKGRHSVQ